MCHSSILVRKEIAAKIRGTFDQVRSTKDDNCSAQAIHVAEGPLGAWDIFVSCSVNHIDSGCGERSIMAWILISLAGKQLRRARQVTVGLSEEGVQAVTNAAVDVLRRMLSLTVVEHVEDILPE